VDHKSGTPKLSELTKDAYPKLGHKSPDQKKINGLFYTQQPIKGCRFLYYFTVLCKSIKELSSLLRIRRFEAKADAKVRFLPIPSK
jgi:hypothetical protein